MAAVKSKLQDDDTEC